MLPDWRRFGIQLTRYGATQTVANNLLLKAY